MELPTSLSVLNQTVGAVQIGISLAVFLFGILTLQVYYYYSHHGGDGPYIKAFTGVVWCLELTRIISLLLLNYHITITEPFASNVNSIHTWSLLAGFGICAFLDAAFQVYYMLRVKMLIRRWDIPLLCWFISFAQFAIVLSAVILLSDMDIDLSAFFVKSYKHLITAVFSCRILLDLVCVSILWYYLPKSESQLSCRKYCLLVIDSGMINCILSICMLATYLGASSAYAWIAFTSVLGVAQMNSLLTCLNSRHLWGSALPLVDAGKKPNVLAFYQAPKITNLNFDIEVQKSNTSSSAPSVNEENHRGSVTVQSKQAMMVPVF